MPRRVLAFAWAVTHWPWRLVFPRKNSAARTRRRVPAMVFAPALTPSLPASSGKSLARQALVSYPRRRIGGTAATGDGRRLVPDIIHAGFRLRSNEHDRSVNKL